MTAPRPELQVSHPSPHRDHVSGLRLLASVTLAPLAWLGQLIVSYFFSSSTCGWPKAPGGVAPTGSLWLILLIANVAFVTVGLIGVYLAWTSWTLSKEEKRGGKEQLLQVGEGRTRFSALSALIVSGIFFVAIFAETCALFIFRDCAFGLGA